ncbi:hypothetical protein B0H13DRAFT_1881121 [Mycena leptocephala]|nr:hypothetical protein B0H13DRAFT_1881121 [Mycena leptocephala]
MERTTRSPTRKTRSQSNNVPTNQRTNLRATKPKVMPKTKPKPPTRSKADSKRRVDVRTTRSTTRKTRSQSNKVPTDQRTNLRRASDKPKVMPKNKPKPPTRSKADSKRRVDEETEGNADADVDDGDGIRVFFFVTHSSAADDFSPWKDSVDEDTANVGENASKSKTPDDVADAQLQNGTDNEGLLGWPALLRSKPPLRLCHISHQDPKKIRLPTTSRLAMETVEDRPSLIVPGDKKILVTPQNVVFSVFWRGAGWGGRGGTGLETMQKEA